MTGLVLPAPVHLRTHPDAPIRTVDDAVKVIERHGRGAVPPDAHALMLELTRAATPAELAFATELFLRWAASEDLLLVPPEDRADPLA
jgi:hypothetical protein